MKNKSFAAVAFVILTAVITASAQNNTFKLESTINGSGAANPAEVIATDFNADGKVDLIGAANVYTNNGKGVFSSSQAAALNIRSNAFMAADVSRRGRMDLIALTNLTTSPFNESIVVYTNSGIANNGFSLGFYSSTTNVGSEISSGSGSLGSAGDVYGNGRANLFYYNANSNSVSLFTNNGAGVFGSNITFGVKMGLPVVADFNRDGKVDFASVGYTNNLVYVFNNNGSGIYASNASFNVKSPMNVFTADVNGDGWADLIVFSVTNNLSSQPVNTISVWTNNGSGVFGSNVTFTVGAVGQRVMDLKAATVFGDGNLDLVFSVNDVSHGAGYLMIYTNNGLGGFGSNYVTASVGSSLSPASLALADLNGDGALDLVSANFGGSSGSITVFTNSGSGIQSGTFISNSTPVVGTNTFFVMAADLYRTGQPQLLTLDNGSSSATLLVLTNNGSGMFGSNAVISGFGNSFPQATPIAADIFGNGSPALILGLQNGSSAGSIVIMTNNGSGVFGTNSSYGTGSLGFSQTPNAIAAADVNGDGKLDLIAACYANGGSSASLLVLTNNGSGGFGTNVTITLGGFSYLAVADVNADGRPDLITAALISGFSKLTVFTNISATGTGPLYSINNNVSYQMTSGANPSGLVTADVNGDGRPDFIIANNNNPGTLTVMTNNGFNNGNNSYTFGLNSSPSVDALPHALVAADVNGDGKIDLISANWGLTTNTVTDLRGPLGYGTLSVLTNNGNGIFTNHATFSTGQGPTAVIASDVNFDGKMDLISANYTGFTNAASVGGIFYYGHGNSLSILLNTSNFLNNTVALQTAPSDSPITYGQTLSAAGLSGGVVTNESGATVSGSFAFTTNSVPAAGTSNYPVTFAVTPPTDYQPITFNVSVTVNQLTAILKGKRAYDGTTNAVFGILSVSNKVGGDNVTVSAGSVGLSDAIVGTNTITSTNGLALGGSTAVNYTLSGVSGSVIITNAINIVALTSSLNPSAHGAGVSFTATLPSYATGTVQFLTNGFLFDSEGLSSGSAGSVATTSLPVGSSTITAAYSGDANNLATTNNLNQLVMAPQFNGVSLGSGGLVMNGSWGTSNGTYYILASTNLSLPISQWPPVITNQFDNNGNFNFTNAIDAGSPQQFYLLQSQ